MKVTKNSAKRMLALLLLILAAVGLTGCGSAKDAATPPAATATEAPAASAAPAGEVKSYTFEAEYVDLTDKAGAGPSNAALETELVLTDTAASNGNYIGYTYFADLFFDYVFTADAAKEATLKIVFGSDLGIVRLNPTVFEISVNGTALDYKEIKLPDSSGKVNKVFKEFNIGKINLVAGENKITLKVLANELYNGGTGGPLIDCVILDTEAALTWEPVTDNAK